MNALIAALIEEHGEVDKSLDRLAEAVATGRVDAVMFRQVAAINAEHYRHEERFLRILRTHDPALEFKLRAQHDEALEIAARLVESLASGETGDVVYLARRYLAIAQHNIIEEERDVFPLADRFFSTEETRTTRPEGRWLMSIRHFRAQDLPQGAHRLQLEIESGLCFPLLAIRGCRPGATLVLSAGVHGDEYEGVRAILETFETLDPQLLSGNLLAVPVLNTPAFWNGTRTSPLDGANLARVFPGDEQGTPTQRIAWHFAHTILARADFYLDLHSGGIKYRMPSMAGYPAADRRAREAAEHFGAGVIWGHPSPIDPGRTVSFASERGIPWLYTEARGAGRIHGDDLRMMKQGIRNLLGHLGILPDKPKVAPPAMRLRGNGNTDSGVTATQPGFLLKEVEILDPVRAGDRLGRLVNLLGEPLEEYRAPSDGVIGMVRELPVVQAGEVLFLTAEREDEWHG